MKKLLIAFLLIASVASAQVQEVPRIKNNINEAYAYQNGISVPTTTEVYPNGFTQSVGTGVMSGVFSSNGSFTAPVSGLYLVNERADYAGHNTGVRDILNDIYGAGGISDPPGKAVRAAAPDWYHSYLSTAFFIYLNKNGSFRPKLYQTSGTTLSTNLAVHVVLLAELP